MAIASKKLRGNTCAMNSRRLSPPVLRLVAMSFSGSGKPRRPKPNQFEIFVEGRKGPADAAA